MKWLNLVIIKLCMWFIVWSYACLFAATIPDLVTVDHENEGFLWKKKLEIIKGEELVSLEKNHANLYQRQKGFCSLLESISDDELVSIVQEVFLCLKEAVFLASEDLRLTREEIEKKVDQLSTLEATFLELYENTQKIGDILGNNPVTREIFSNPIIRKILYENFKRLKRRNFCTASFSYYPEDGEFQEIPLRFEDKPIIFISGADNELIRILEHHSRFDNAAYAIFGNKLNEITMPTDLFSKHLNCLYVNSVPIIADKAIQEQTRDCKREVDKLAEAKHEAEKIQKEACKKTTEFLATHLNTLEITSTHISELPIKLIRAKENWHKAFIDFKDKFCDSEQLIRCFLFNGIEELLEPLPLTANGLLILNLNSSLDSCKYCTNALFLETFLRDKEAFIHEKKKIYSGFFHKFYNEMKRKQETERKILPNNIFIFVSSERVGANGNITRRLLSGRSTEEDSLDSPINLDNPIRLYFRYNGP